MSLASSVGVDRSVQALRATAANSVRPGRAVVVDDEGLAPDLRRGDVLGMVSVASSRELRPGDVVEFRFRSRTYVRRYDGRDGTNLVMRDSVGYEDIVPWSDLMGRAAWCTRDGEERWIDGVRDITPRSLMEQLRRWLRRRQQK